MPAPLSTHDRIELWPDGVAPGSEDSPARYTISERSADVFWPHRVASGITRPSLTAYPAACPNGCALIVAPGGGYEFISLDVEAAEMAVWLNPLGVSVFVLHYRLPAEGHAAGADAPLADAQRALRVVRSNAGDWGVDPQRVGFIGSSAGGHLGALLGTQYARPTYAPVDEADRLSARPDFLILLYPVISMADGLAHAGSRQHLLGAAPSAAAIAAYSAERQVDAQSSPAFIVVAEDDPAVLPGNAVLFHQALRRCGVASELHAFAAGGHGFGIREARQPPLSDWPRLAAEWLAGQGWLAD